MATLPPWLNVQPSDFAAAAARGIQFSQRRNELAEQAREANVRASLEASGQATQLAESQARIQQENQRLQQEQEMAHMELQAKQEQAQRDFLLSQQQNNIRAAYQTASLGLRKRELDDAAQENAMRIGDVQGYMNAVQQGMDPSKAAAQFPRAVTAGVATQLTKTATAQPTEEAPKLSELENIDYRHALQVMDRVPGQIQKIKEDQIDLDQIPMLQEQLGKAQDTVNKIRARISAPKTATQNPYEGKRVRDKVTGQTGKIVNGEFVPDEQQENAP